MPFDIGIFIEYEGTVVQIPVNPEKLTITRSGNNKKTEIIELGEINLLRDTHLRQVSWESWFPYADWHPAIRTAGSFKSNDYYEDFFNKIMDDKRPAQLVLTGIGLSMKVSVENFTFYHEGGDFEDTYYSIDLQEYRPHSVTRAAVTAAYAKPSAPKPKQKVNPATGGVPPTQITVGCDVILNGRVHGSSYGEAPGKTFSGYRGKISSIQKGRSHPYHVTTPAGGWLGWVIESAVTLA